MSVLQDELQFLIEEEEPNHKWRTEIPNIVWELGLGKFAFIAYITIKKIAGDGGLCFMSKSNLSEECMMSKRTLDEAIKELEKPLDLIGKKSLIVVQESKKMDGGDTTKRIYIRDIWPENGKFFREKKHKKPPTNGGVQGVQGGGAGRAPKEEQCKEEHIKGQCNTRSRETPVKKPLPFSKEKKCLTGEEIQFCSFMDQQIKNHDPSSDTDSLPYFVKKFGVDKVAKAWQYAKSQKNIKNTLAYMRTGLEKGWNMPDEQSKVLCQMFYDEFPQSCVMNKKYLSFLDKNHEIYFSLDVEDVIYQLEKERTRLTGRS